MGWVLREGCCSLNLTAAAKPGVTSRKPQRRAGQFGQVQRGVAQVNWGPTSPGTHQRLQRRSCTRQPGSPPTAKRNENKWSSSAFEHARSLSTNELGLCLFFVSDQRPFLRQWHSSASAVSLIVRASSNQRPQSAPSSPVRRIGSGYMSGCVLESRSDFRKRRPSCRSAAPSSI